MARQVSYWFELLSARGFVCNDRRASTLIQIKNGRNLF
jgi:hypothetical protein